MKTANIAFFLKPKSEVTYLYDDMPLPEALDIMHRNGYSSVPVINREGLYLCAVSEGDFLWAFAQTDGAQLKLASARSVSEKRVGELLEKKRNPSAHINTPIEALLGRSTEQNFVPIVDDRGIFIGIVTRRNVINYFLHPQTDENA